MSLRVDKLVVEAIKAIKAARLAANEVADSNAFMVDKLKDRVVRLERELAAATMAVAATKQLMQAEINELMAQVPTLTTPIKEVEPK